MKDQEQIAHLENAIEELKARFPKHSVSAAMMIELEELEEDLETLRSRALHDSD
jgi:TolA-binding protein